MAKSSHEFAFDAHALAAGQMLRAAKHSGGLDSASQMMIKHLLDIGSVGVLKRRLALHNARHGGEVTLTTGSVI